MEHGETGHAERLGEVSVDLGDLAQHELEDLRSLGKVGVGGVRDAATLGPLADRLGVDVEESHDPLPAVSEGHRFLDVGRELQLVLQERRREARPVTQLAHVLGPVDDHEMPVGVEVALVAGAAPFAVEDGLGGLSVLEIATEDGLRPGLDLPSLADADLHTGGGLAHRVGLDAGLVADRDPDLGGAVDLLERHTQRVEPAHHVRAEGGAAGVDPLGPQEPEMVAQRSEHQPVGDGVGLRVVSVARSMCCGRRAPPTTTCGSPPMGSGTDLLVETPYGELPRSSRSCSSGSASAAFGSCWHTRSATARSRRTRPADCGWSQHDLLVQVTAASVVAGGRSGSPAWRTGSSPTATPT